MEVIPFREEGKPFAVSIIHVVLTSHSKVPGDWMPLSFGSAVFNWETERESREINYTFKNYNENFILILEKLLAYV